MTAVGAKKKLVELINSDSDDADSSAKLDAKKVKSSDLSINKNYAQRYDTWRGKEELQKRTYAPKIKTRTQVPTSKFYLFFFYSER